MNPAALAPNVGTTSQGGNAMGQRPDHVKPPEYLSKSPPVPQPAPAEATDDPLGTDPTRYGDWELKGIAVDF
ncbi:hypothetical protein TS85_20325 [Sphingomonas hengshuiensis]|uniref:DUF1674 domain-containing protein n=2 Tax=Sphingomonas hengshuiensis TaxID=1609977 RepID=A0A7U4JBA4_9SPHN|nr:hypothetical protein TS85_20325 [Sphingomonas hengshuiensis]